MNVASQSATRNQNTGLAESEPRRLARWRLAVQILFVLILAGSAVSGVIWWREKPLREAEQALADNDPEYADYLLLRYLMNSPNDVKARALKARVEVKRGNYRAALQVFDEIGTASMADVHALAQAYLAEQRWSMAIPLLEHFLRAEPTNADALHELTVARTRLGHLDRAQKLAERMAAIPGNEAQGRLLLASIQSDLNNFSGAAASLKIVLERHPDARGLVIPPHEVFMQYGRVLMRLGKPKESLEPLQKSASLRESPEVLSLLGQAASQLGESNKARSAWLAVLRHDTLHAFARESLANLALQNGNPKEAFEWMKPLEHSASIGSNTAYLFQRVCHALGDSASSEKWKQRADAVRATEKRAMMLEMILVESPDSFWARAVRAHRFATNGNWDEAEVMIRRLLVEAPQEPFVADLATAIQSKSQIPSLDRVPIQL